MPISIDKKNNKVTVTPGDMTVTCWNGKEEHGAPLVLLFYPDGFISEVTFENLEALGETETPMVAIELPVEVVRDLYDWLRGYLEGKAITGDNETYERITGTPDKHAE